MLPDAQLDAATVALQQAAVRRGEGLPGGSPYGAWLRVRYGAPGYRSRTLAKRANAVLLDAEGGLLDAEGGLAEGG